jgi:hypothetical protein
LIQFCCAWDEETAVNFAHILLNLILLTIGGVLGNILAAWLLQDVWHNVFTLPRLLGTVAGLVAVTGLLAWLDYRGRHAPPPQAAGGGQNMQRVVQVGNPIIRILEGTNLYGILQFGSGRIEVVERRTSKPPAPAPAGGEPPRMQAASRQALAAEHAALEHQIRGLAPRATHDAEAAQQLAALTATRDRIAAEITRIDALPNHTTSL